MQGFALALRFCAVACIAAATLHLVLGVRAERLLDPGLPEALVGLASLDSQNRFYGTTFMVYGALLWRCALDPAGHAPVLRVLLAVFFAGGLARLLSVAVVGWPAPPIIALAALELLLPPLLYGWLMSCTRADPRA